MLLQTVTLADWRDQLGIYSHAAVCKHEGFSQPKLFYLVS